MQREELNNTLAALIVKVFLLKIGLLLAMRYLAKVLERSLDEQK